MNAGKRAILTKYKSLSAHYDYHYIDGDFTTFIKQLGVEKCNQMRTDRSRRGTVIISTKVSIFIN